MLNDLDEFTEVGLDLARSSVRLLDETVGEAVAELQSNIERLERGDYRDKDVTQSLAAQLDSIRIGY
jgi:hypothetical protein